MILMARKPCGSRRDSVEAAFELSLCVQRVSFFTLLDYLELLPLSGPFLYRMALLTTPLVVYNLLLAVTVNRVAANLWILEKTVKLPV